MDKKIWTEPTISTEQVFKGKVIDLQVDTVELPDGRTATREIVRHPGAAAVVAIQQGKMIVVDQYRKALGKAHIEIAARKLYPNQDPHIAAIREVEEETGFIAQEVKLLHAFYTSPAFPEEKLYVYYTDHQEA